MDITALLLSRLQFALTVTYHIIFPAFTIGLAAWLTVLEALHVTTGRPVYRTLFDFWLKIFGIAFGLGVVSGVVMAFQFGTTGRFLVESKSLKLYLASFRNHGAFHEDCTVGIGKKLLALLKPKYLRIGGYWYPRGGMPIDVFWQAGKLPKDVWLPDQGVAPYRGRG